MGEGSEQFGEMSIDYRLQGARVLELPKRSAIADLTVAIQQGFKFEVFTVLCSRYGAPRQLLADTIGVSQSTLNQRERDGRFNEPESDRLLRVAGLYGVAENVVLDRAMAIDWMQTPNRGLGGHTPLAYAKSEAGAREVEYLLGRIAHGIVA